MYLTSCADFITCSVSLEDAKKQRFFLEFKEVAMLIAHGELSLESDSTVVQFFSEHVKQSWLPFPSSAQLVESKVKDSKFCTSIGKEEQNVSKFATMRSVMLHDVTAAIKESDSFKNRKDAMTMIVSTRVGAIAAPKFLPGLIVV